MVFSSLLFTFFFLPVTLFLYYISKNEYKNYILLAASLFFYAYGEPRFVFIMIALILVNYILAIGIDRYKKEQSQSGARAILILDIVINIGLLFVYKYLDFSISVINRVFDIHVKQLDIALPVGISFFTFQALSYVIDVYKGGGALYRKIRCI